MVAGRSAALSPRGSRRHRLSKSATKARITLEVRKRIVDILRFFSRSIPPRGAFVADLDTSPLWIVPGAPRVPPRSCPAATNLVWETATACHPDEKGSPGLSRRGRRCGAGDRRGGGGVSRGARTGPGSRWGPSRAGWGLPGPVVEVLHIGKGRPCGWISGFPHDSGVLSRRSVFSGRAPMCRRVRSAHGRISPALNAGVFSHDSADSPPAGPGRMCSTAPTGPGTAHPTRLTLHARPMPPDGDRPEDVTDLLIHPRSLPVRKTRSGTTVKTLTEADDDRWRAAL